jgi:hypothetical protein
MAKPGKAQQSAARSERLAAALRENLKRRKAQARDRAGGQPPGDAKPQDAAKRGAGVPDFRRNQGSE